MNTAVTLQAYITYMYTAVTLQAHVWNVSVECYVCNVKCIHVYNCDTTMCAMSRLRMLANVKCQLLTCVHRLHVCCSNIYGVCMWSFNKF